MFLRKLNKQGAALLQVLVVSAILAGLATMILRLTLTRTVAANQARRAASTQKMIESCMTEVNMLWGSKATEPYADDLAACQMCSTSRDSAAGCTSSSIEIAGRSFPRNHVYVCSGVEGIVGSQVATVYAIMENSGGRCVVNYVIPGGVNL